MNHFDPLANARQFNRVNFPYFPFNYNSKREKKKKKYSSPKGNLYINSRVEERRNMISTGAAAIKLLPSFIIRYEKCRKNILRIEYISLHLAPRLIRLKGGGRGGGAGNSSRATSISTFTKERKKRRCVENKGQRRNNTAG